MNKFKWRNRIIIIETSSYKDENYIKTKNIYEKNIQNFHKRYIKLTTDRNKDNDFNIKLIDFDGTLLHLLTFQTPIYNKIEI